jgi:hypothetical protein
MTDAGSLIAARYEVRGTLGKGGFGRTFLASDRESGRTVAVKMLETGRADDWKAYELFEREAAVLRSLRHHGIPEVHASMRDRWEGADAAFLVMEYVDGVPLQRVIEERRHLEPGDVLHLFIELLGILEYLHSRVPPILHRDVKPANIIIRPTGFPALVDFGAVRSVFKAPGESGSTVVGTYGYMPYEQYMGQAGPTSDLYALGATMLHVLTGRPPQDFMTDEGRIAVPESLPGDERLRGVVSRLLRPSPVERFQSAREVRDALLGSAATARPGSLPVPARNLAPAPALGAAPRELTRELRAHLSQVAGGMWDLANGTVKGGRRATLMDVISFAFFSLITAGVMPMVFLSVASARKSRLKDFFREGQPAEARIEKIELEEIAFGEKLARVSYEYEADGGLRRDADLVLPARADRWRAGDRVCVLYIAQRGYESAIISL